ncbi:Protein OS-9 [Microbotryomycetes sp. JL201]|nr:Protein OS-9 [Microbotryomycetes sp. JL201]
MIIHTPRLCSEAVFLEGHDASTEPSHQIECRPIVTKGPPLVEAGSKDESGKVQVNPVDEPAERGESESADSEQATVIARNADRSDDVLGDVPHQALTSHVDRDDLSEALEGEFEEVEIGYILDPTTGAVRQATAEEMDLALKDGATEFAIDADLGPEGDDMADDEVEALLLGKMEDMAKVMRESISQALQDGRPDDTPLRDAPPEGNTDDDRPVPNIVSAIQEALEKAKRPASDSNKPTLDLSRLRAMLKDSLEARGKAEREVLGAEEHSKLLEAFQKSYQWLEEDNNDGHGAAPTGSADGGDRSEGVESDAKSVHDEL